MHSPSESIAPSSFTILYGSLDVVGQPNATFNVVIKNHTHDNYSDI